MTSQLKAQTNRSNALASTGPRTVEGKLVSRANATKRGLRSADVVVQVGLFSESAEEYEALLASLQEAIQPEGALESALAETVAACLWRKRRVLRYERGVIAQQLATLRPRDMLGQVLPGKPEALAWFESEGQVLLRTSSRVRGLLRALADVRARVVEHGTLQAEDKDRLFDTFGTIRRGVALQCAVHASMAEETQDGSARQRGSAKWHIEQAILVLDQETARLQALLPEIERLEASVQEAERAQATLPGEAALAKIMRYESHLDRQLHRALTQLERLQRPRLGDVVPAPLQLDLTVT
jgi:hypothetical protein